MKIYKPKQFGELLGVSVSTLKRWDTTGKLLAKRTPSGRRFYTQDDYDKFLLGESYSE